MNSIQYYLWEVSGKRSVPNLDVLVRKTMCSLMTRHERSENSLIQAVINMQRREDPFCYMEEDKLNGWSQKLYVAT